jgi:hypothetical protein
MNVTVGGGVANVIDVAGVFPQAIATFSFLFLSCFLFTLGSTRQLYMDVLVFILASPASFHRNRCAK